MEKIKKEIIIKTVRVKETKIIEKVIPKCTYICPRVEKSSCGNRIKKNVVKLLII